MTKTVFVKGSKRKDVLFFSDVPEKKQAIPSRFLREELRLPDICETDVIRHYVGLAGLNHGVDNGFYPLGSCTMKYNPKVNEWAAALPGFSGIHPLADAEDSQGCLWLMHDLDAYLCELTGMAGFTLSPAAGAHGELAGVMIMKKYFESRGEKRTKILIPDSAHGTNPASAALCGFEVVVIPSDSRGNIDLDELKKNVDPSVAGIMVTIPNTLGLFDENIMKVADAVHSAGGLVYCDGANMNAMLGIVKPSEFGTDVLHLNLHKTFSTPHGGGGPGSGPLGVVKRLVEFLPVPRVVKKGEKYSLVHDSPGSIGQIRAFSSNFGVLVKAYAYIRALGPGGLKRVAETAVLSANYLKEKLKQTYDLPYDRVCQHEFVLSDKGMPNDVTTNDIAKRLIDYRIHPPTVYFPLIVHGAIMIEPTETESLHTLDKFCKVMEDIRKEAEENPDILKRAPVKAPVGRLDAVAAAREPVLREEL